MAVHSDSVLCSAPILGLAHFQNVPTGPKSLPDTQRHLSLLSLSLFFLKNHNLLSLFAKDGSRMIVRTGAVVTLLINCLKNWLVSEGFLPELPVVTFPMTIQSFSILLLIA